MEHSDYVNLQNDFLNTTNLVSNLIAGVLNAENLF